MYRKVGAFRTYFADFLKEQTQKVKDKIYWTLRLIEDIPQVPEAYLKKLEGTDGYMKFAFNLAAIYIGFSVSLTMEN